MEPPPPPLTRFVTGAVTGGSAARWQVLAAMCAAGGVLGILCGVIADVPQTAAAGAIAVGFAVALAALAGQLDARLLGPLLALGATTVTLALVAAGSDGEPLIVLHVWVAAVGWWMLSYRGAAALSLLTIGLGAVTVAVLPGGVAEGLLLWAVTATSIAGVGAVAALLRLRGDRLEAQLHELVDRDALTGVVNRRGFCDRTAAALSRQRRAGGSVALVLCELDDFRAVGDRFGAALPDELLRRFAAACDGELRGADVVARVGDERFALLLPDADADAAVAVAERIRERLPHALRTPDGAAVTVSFGVAAVPRHAPDADGLLDAAAGALHAAKRAGSDLVLRAGTVWPVAR